MGKLISKPKEMKVLMLGLDGAGKTTILYRLKLGEIVHEIPTMGFNVEKIHYKNIKLKVFDIGGAESIRPLWCHYFNGTQALVFVIDSTDRDRMRVARKELHYILKYRELRDAVILIFANKQDLPNAMKPYEIEEELQLSNISNQKWFLQPSCATFDDGLLEGFAWLTSNYRPKAKTVCK